VLKKLHNCQKAIGTLPVFFGLYKQTSMFLSTSRWIYRKTCPHLHGITATSVAITAEWQQWLGVVYSSSLLAD